MNLWYRGCAVESRLLLPPPLFPVVVLQALELCKFLFVDLPAPINVELVKQQAQFALAEVHQCQERRRDLFYGKRHPLHGNRDRLNGKSAYSTAKETHHMANKACKTPAYLRPALSYSNANSLKSNFPSLSVSPAANMRLSLDLLRSLAVAIGQTLPCAL